MNEQQNDGSAGQTGMDSETERRNRENETGQQWQQQPQSQTGQPQQSGTTDRPTDNFATDKQGSEGGSGFVGSSSDTSSDYLTDGDKQSFAPEGQGASNAGTADIETGQPSATDATLDDGSDTSR